MDESVWNLYWGGVNLTRYKGKIEKCFLAPKKYFLGGREKWEFWWKNGQNGRKSLSCDIFHSKSLADKEMQFSAINSTRPGEFEEKLVCSYRVMSCHKVSLNIWNFENSHFE